MTMVSAPPRLVLAAKRAQQAVLDGAWWPRSWDAAAELPGLVEALSQRYGRVRYTSLNRPAWTNHIGRSTNGGGALHPGWFNSQNPALLVVTTDSGDQIDLLVVPPGTAQVEAEQMMAAAADPANRVHAADLLAAKSEPLTADDAKAVWDNEGGVAGPRERFR
jgi:hypothetical protein